MREEPNRHVWKACEAQVSVGSNLTPSGMITDQQVMSFALAEARHALAHDDVPVDAVVIHNDTIIALRHNERELCNDPTAHAEVLVLRNAAYSLGRWRLKGESHKSC